MIGFDELTSRFPGDAQRGRLQRFDALEIGTTRIASKVDRLIRALEPILLPGVQTEAGPATASGLDFVAVPIGQPYLDLPVTLEQRLLAASELLRLALQALQLLDPPVDIVDR